MKRILLGCVLVLVAYTTVMADGEPVAMNLLTVQKIENQAEDFVDYIYTLDYVHDYGHTGPLFDWHVNLGEWTPGQITITPPANWAGEWQGGTYGCQTNNNPYYFGNQYYGSWTIRVKWGYGDGTTTYTFTDSLHNVVGFQDGVQIPQLPEPATLSLLMIGSMAIMRRRHCR